MKKILLAGAALVLLLVALAALGYGVHLVRKLDTPEFQKALLEQAKATVGADVRVKEMDISLLSGVTLRGIVVANPAPFTGDLLAAEAFVLRYRLRPLLAGRVEVERLALEKPALALAMDARGGFNYEKLGGAASRPSAAPAAAAVVPFRVVLKRLSVEDASIVMTDHTKARLLTVEDADFRSAFEIEGGMAQGEGEATVATVNLADLLFVRGVRSPLAMSKETVRLAPIRGRVAGGEVTGDVTVHLRGGFRYVANLEVKGAEVEDPAGRGEVDGRPDRNARREGHVRGEGRPADPEGPRAGDGHRLPRGAREDARAAGRAPPGARAREPRLRGVPRGVHAGGRPPLDAGAEPQGGRGPAHRPRHRQPRHERPRLPDDPRARPEALRQGHPPRAASRVQAGRATASPRSTSGSTGRRSSRRPTSLTRIGKAAATEAAKEQVNKLFKRKVF